MHNNHLAELAQTLLDVTVARFTAAGLDVPERQYIHAGEVAFDCPQLVVSFNRVYHGLPAAEVSGEVPCAVFRTAEFQITLNRCVPIFEDDGDPPDPSDLTAAGIEGMVDAWVLQQSLIEAYREGELQEICFNLAVGSVVAIGPEGGVGGVTCLVSMQV